MHAGKPKIAFLMKTMHGFSRLIMIIKMILIIIMMIMVMIIIKIIIIKIIMIIIKIK